MKNELLGQTVEGAQLILDLQETLNEKFDNGFNKISCQSFTAHSGHL